MGLEEALLRHHLTQKQLNVPISFEHCSEFAGKLTEWEPLAPRLGLEDVEIATIQKDHAQSLRSQCSACLTKWQGKLGSEATFWKLARALENVQSMDRVDKLCEIFKTVKPSTSVLSPRDENGESVRKAAKRASPEVGKMTEGKMTEAIRAAETRASKAEKRAKKAEEHWLVVTKQIHMTEEVLHEGKWGDIKVAKFGRTRVAAKSFNLANLKQPASSQPGGNTWRTKFIREMNIIAQFHHPNLVQFIGAYADHKTIIVLTELMHISLKKQLMMEDIHFTKSQIITISLDVANALNYLHCRDIVHDNVTSDHILLEPLADQQWKAKVIDNGMHNLQKALLSKPDMYKSPSKYSTPESDIYSLGVVMYNMCDDIFNYGVVLGEMCTSDHNVVQEIQELLACIKDEELKGLITKCTLKARKNRPSADEIIAELEAYT